MNNNPSKKFVNYFEDLSALFSKTQVFDKDGNHLEFEKGLSNTVEMIDSSSKLGGKVYFIGNGGSASIASHMAVDFWKNGGIKAACFSDASMITCISNDFGFEFIFEKSILGSCSANDIIFAISSSGNSTNIHKGVMASLGLGCKVVTLSGFSSENKLRSMGVINFYVPSKFYGFVELVHTSICHAILDYGFYQAGDLA